MRQSLLWTKTRKEAPSEEVSINAQLLERGGYIAKLMSGVYSYLPLGLRVLRKIEDHIRHAMNAIGGQEIFLPALQPKELWEKTGRWRGLAPIMYQFRDHSKKEIGLGVTHEEVVAHLLKESVVSYRDLPVSVYQIQTKFRHEPRPRSGLLRAREFGMKDLYSCHVSQDECDMYYEKVASSYDSLLKTLSLSARRVEASGGDFSETRSHEFQVPCEVGEDMILLCDVCDLAENAEISKLKDAAPCQKCKKGSIRKKSAVEVANIFKLGTKYTEAIGAYFIDHDGKRRPIVMASYGFGPSRVLGTIVEVHHDTNGILWPESVSPFSAHLLILGNDELAIKIAENLYAQCQKAGLEVLLDDRPHVSPAEKLKDADLLGIPHRFIFSSRQGKKMEYKRRGSNKSKTIAATVAAFKKH